MALRLSVARNTVTVAYDRLAGEGFVTSRVGSGTFVNSHGARSLRESKGQQTRGALHALPVWNSIPLSTAFARPAQFDFRTGLPDASLFPHEKWRRLIASGLKSEALRGGVYDSPAGSSHLREAIARHISIARGMDVTAENVTIVNGTQQGIDVVARTLLAAGDRVAVEDPGYQPARWLLESLGARVDRIPVDAEGIVVDALHPRTRLVYVTPSHQYPLGTTMTLARRRALLTWAERNHAVVFEDDYDSEFRFGGRPIEPLQTLDVTGRVIYAGSFSKTMLPTLRLGFIVTPPSLCAAVHKAKQVSDWHTGIPLQMALTQFIESGQFARHVRKMCAVYAVRHQMVTEILTRDFADHLEVLPSIAGLHVAALARSKRAELISGIVRKASLASVEVQELSRFTASASGKVGIVLGYGAIPTAKIREGLRRLRHCFEV